MCKKLKERSPKIFRLESGPGLDLSKEPHALKGQRTLYDVACTKRKCSETDGQPRQLRNLLDPGILLTGDEEHKKQQAAAIAARPPPLPPRPVGRPWKLPDVGAPPIPKVVWVQLLLFMPPAQLTVSLCLHLSPGSGSSQRGEGGAGGGVGPMEVSSESEVTSEEDTDMQV